MAAFQLRTPAVLHHSTPRRSVCSYFTHPASSRGFGKYEFRKTARVRNDSSVRATLRDFSWCTTPKYTGDAKEDLLQAVKYNDEPKFRECLSRLGPDAANTTWGGRRYNQSVLLACCFRGRTHMIEHLVEAGADCAHRNDFGWGAVKYAKQFYYVLKMYDEGDRVIELLVRNGAEDVKEWRGDAGVSNVPSMD